MRNRLVAYGRPPLDLSQEEQRDAFLSSLKNWMTSMAGNEDNTKFGYPDIEWAQIESFSHLDH
ncbi:hypothetical protein PFICI_01682 [Pestalotiopsis fici W106-1]|uniref:Uncharacterized protein n=1 Tax=Pestalotiopsis fici (strain W106-1 / CGMCC3.15140) TaxID=1229662 RepID=W3XPF7_PESFW|nr:uncharacterized protein PFICI_01682 [Pestalotiopsis fici W106-1]ETS87854.1 hypothetical protein PFICI_01682 [Pestalotiopsis fici W106-1]